MKKKVKVKSLSCVPLFAALWTVAHQAPPPPMGFSRQESWSGLPFSPPRDLPNLEIELRSPTLQADSLLILTAPPGVEPAPSALEIWSLNHWTTR